MNNVDFTNFLNSMLASITTTQVLNILASVIGVGMTFFLMWLGVRLITNRFTKAVEGGKLSTLSYTADYYMEKPPTPKVHETWNYIQEMEYKNEGLHETYYKKPIEGGNITSFSNGELRKALITNSAFSEATMVKYDKPMEPVEPSGKPMTKAQRKEFDDYYATHDMFGHKLGYDKRQWENYYKKNANKYKKKYNNYKKNYYYDSYGNKYYK